MPRNELANGEAVEHVVADVYEALEMFDIILDTDAVDEMPMDFGEDVQLI